MAEPFKLPGGEAGFDMWPAFRALKGRPTLLLHGALSDLLTAESAEQMKAEHPELTLVTVPRVGHAPTLDEPESVAAIDTLLKKVRASRSGFDFPYDNSTDAYSAVLCTDAAQPRKQSTWTKAIAKRSATVPYFAEAWGWSDAQCARQYWTAKDEDRYRGSFSRRTAKPVLIIGDYYDPATAYTGAVSTHRRMPNSWLISSDSWGHTAYGTSDCVTDQVDAYLLHGSQPSGEVCESDYVPFTDPITNPTAAAVMTQAAAFGMGPMTAR